MIGRPGPIARSRLLYFYIVGRAYYGIGKHWVQEARKDLAFHWAIWKDI